MTVTSFSTARLETARKLLSDGLTEIAIDPAILAEHVETIKDGMRRLSDNREAQALFPYTIVRKDEMGWDEDAGFISVRDEETKDYFHHHRGIHWDVSSSLGRSFRPFLESCGALTTHAERNVLDLVESVDEVCGSEFARLFAHQYVVTRVVRYHKINAQIKEDAFPHFDRNAMTHHWYGTHPGLMVRKGDTLVRVDELAFDRAALFPGKKFLAVTEGRFGDHGMHGVRDTRKVSSGDDRIAIITFAHCRMPDYAIAWLKNNDRRLKDLAHSYAQ